MSLDDQEIQDFVTRTGQHIRLRPYRNEDYHQVRDLFMYCMGYGPGAPRDIGLPDQLRQPFAFATYSISTVGLALAICPSLSQPISRAAYRVPHLLSLPIQTLLSKFGMPHVLKYLHPSQLLPNLYLRSRTWPLVLSVLSAGSLLAFLAFINHRVFIGYCKECLDDDLKDISGHYQRPEALKKGSQFWVIEDMDKGNIVACVGLDATTDSVPEVRRMNVHPSYRRLGLGHRLVDVLLSYTIKHNTLCKPEHKIAEIILETSTYQPGAVRMYEQHGWAVEKTEQAEWYVRGFYLVHMRRKVDVNA